MLEMKELGPKAPTLKSSFKVFAMHDGRTGRKSRKLMIMQIHILLVCIENDLINHLNHVREFALISGMAC